MEADRTEVEASTVLGRHQGAAFQAQRRNCPSGMCPVSRQELGARADSAMQSLVLVLTVSPGCIRELAPARNSLAAAILTARRPARVPAQGP